MSTGGTTASTATNNAGSSAPPPSPKAACKGGAGACPAKACSVDSWECAGDTLRTCKPDESGFIDVEMCKPGLCDRASKQCDVCVPNEARCEGDAVMTCDGTGQNERRQLCPSGQPHCTDDGKCVACRNDADCGSSKHCDLATNQCVECQRDADCSTLLDCRVASCGSGGKCVVNNAPPRTRCGRLDVSLCSMDGRCVECMSNADCPAAMPACNPQNNACVECTTASQCAAGETCTMNACEKTCGNGRLDPNKSCDPTVTNDWHCDSSCRIVGGEYTWRLCSAAGQCDTSREDCAMFSDTNVPGFCAPDATKLGGSCSNAFPNAYRGREFGALPYCLLSCQTGTCPSHTQCSTALGAAQPLCLPK